MTEKKKRGVKCPTCAECLRRLWTKKNVKDGTISHVHECKNSHKWRVFKGVPVEQIKVVAEVEGKKIISRSEAMERGLPLYFTGKTCKYGHMSEKRTKNGYCVECKKIFLSEKKEQKEPRDELTDVCEVKSPTQAEIRKELEELRRKYPNVRVIKGYAQSGSK